MSAEKAHSDILDLVLHAIPDPGSLSPWAAAYRFAAEHFEGHERVVEFIHGDYSPGGEWSGIVELMEDDTYRTSFYRTNYNRKAGRWEFRARVV